MNNLPLPWPVTVDTINAELAAMAQIVARWQSRFSDEQFLADFDSAPEMERLQVFAQFTNELKVVASKSATMVEIIQ